MRERQTERKKGIFRNELQVKQLIAKWSANGACSPGEYRTAPDN